MKIFSKILGISNAVLVVAIYVTICHSFIEYEPDKNDFLILIGLTIFVVFLINFYIIYDFGFNENFSMNNKKASTFKIFNGLLVISFIVVVFLWSLNQSNSKSEQNDATKEMIILRTDTTLHDFIGTLKLKTIDSILNYQLSITSSTNLENYRNYQFLFELLDGDNFALFKEEIENITRLIDGSEFKAIGSKGTIEMPFNKIKQVKNWNLLIREK